jgi:hypothetical protein
MKQNKQNNRKNGKSKTPFYAQLLSRQEMQHSSGGGPTKPSLDLLQTMKYPSDGDETTNVTDAAI